MPDRRLIFILFLRPTLKAYRAVVFFKSLTLVLAFLNIVMNCLKVLLHVSLIENRLPTLLVWVKLEVN